MKTTDHQSFRGRIEETARELMDELDKDRELMSTAEKISYLRSILPYAVGKLSNVTISTDSKKSAVTTLIEMVEAEAMKKRVNQNNH